jgi:hypothetical protein
MQMNKVVGGGPGCDSCFNSVLTISSTVEKRRPIEGNGGWTGGDGTCLYFPPQALSKKMLADPGLGLVLELELPIMGRWSGVETRYGRMGVSSAVACRPFWEFCDS